MSHRPAKISHVVREVVSDAIANRIWDPRVSRFTSVTRVEVSDDLRIASVYVSVMGAENEALTTMKGLESARGMIQSRVARRLDIRQCPMLRFHLMLPDFDGFDVESELGLSYVTMTRYKEGYPVEIAFAPTSLELVFGELAEREGLHQLRVAETEKYAHVTFFFNGGKEQPFKGEDRILIPSPKVDTYDLQPEMNAPVMTEKVLAAVADGRHDVMIMNFANPDMVGHTGDFDASVKAVEAVDRAVGAISDAIRARGGGVLLTADHGNVEKMFDRETGQAHTAHTTNPVPLALIHDGLSGRRLRPGGRLADVIPTLLDVMSIDQPDVMNGSSLLE